MRLSFPFAFLTGLLIIQQARACQVPVFRYALERWQADDYHAVFIHQGALTKSKKKPWKSSRKQVVLYSKPEQT